MNVIFVKWGTKYSSAYVNKLVRKLYPTFDKFYCFTDDPEGIDSYVNIIPIPKDLHLKKWWNKLYMFSADFPLSGPTLFFDLDIRINKNPAKHFVDVNWDALTVVGAWHKMDNEVYSRPQNYDVTMHSSVIAWNADNEKIHAIWDHFNTGQRDYYLRKYKGIDRFITHEEFEYELFPEELTRSEKYEHDIAERVITTFEDCEYVV